MLPTRHLTAAEAPAQVPSAGATAQGKQPLSCCYDRVLEQCSVLHGEVGDRDRRHSTDRLGLIQPARHCRGPPHSGGIISQLTLDSVAMPAPTFWQKGLHVILAAVSDYCLGSLPHAPVQAPSEPFKLSTKCFEFGGHLGSDWSGAAECRVDSAPTSTARRVTSTIPDYPAAGAGGVQSAKVIGVLGGVVPVGSLMYASSQLPLPPQRPTLSVIHM